MPEQWYYSRDKQKFGPFTGSQLVKLARAGKLLPSDVLVAKWDAASAINGLFPEGTAGGEGRSERDRMGDSMLLRDIVNLTSAPDAAADDEAAAEAERLRGEVDQLKQELAKHQKALERQVQEQSDSEARLRGQVELLQQENRSYRDTVDRQSEQMKSLSSGEINALSSAQTADMTAENAELRQVIDRLHGHLKEAEEKASGRWKVREQEYEGLLDEKSEVIRQLHSQIQELQSRPAGGGAEGPTEEELLALHEQLQQERQQLKEDEKALMATMRAEEVKMSKERADFARQRGELQRLQSDLKRELEVVSRDAAVREKLAPLYKLQEEILNRRAGEGQRPPSMSESSLPSRAPQKPTQRAAEPRPAPRSGFFRRLFQRDQES